MREIIAVFAVAAINASPALAQSGAMRGVGTGSCGEFAKAYRTNPQLAEVVWGTWAQGLMSGMNLQLAIDGKRMRLIPPPDQGESAHFRQVCDSRPLAPFYDVVFNYFNSLPLSQAKNSN
jgi:hypothetical protein